MDTILIFKCTLIGQEKIFVLIKLDITIVIASIIMSTNWRNRFLLLGLHYLNPPSLNSKVTKQRKYWEEHKVLQRDKGMQTQV